MPSTGIRRGQDAVERAEPDLAIDEAFDAAGETVAEDPGMTSLGVASGSEASVSSPCIAGRPTPATITNRGDGVDRTCVLCGIDCHQQPRTKDTRGRYFCLPCFHRALAAKEAGRPLKLPRREAKVGAGSGGSHSGSALDELILPEDSPLRSAELTASSSALLGGSACAMLCPECQTPMPAESTCCASCGAHTLGGSRWATRALGDGHRTRRSTERRSAPCDAVIEESELFGLSEEAWTTLMGGVSTGLGAVGVIAGIALTASAIYAFATGAHSETLIARAILGPGVAILAGWKLSAGIDCLRGRSVAVDHLRSWATTTLVLLAIAAAAWIGWTFRIDPDWSSRLHHSAFAVVGAVLLSIWPLVIRWWSRRAPATNAAVRAP